MATTSARGIKSPSLAQKQAQALTALADAVGRFDARILTAAVVTAVWAEVERNRDGEWVHDIRSAYDELTRTTHQERSPSAPLRRPKVLTPIVEAGEVPLDRDAPVDAYILQRVYGNHQLRDALEQYSLATLKEMAESVKKRSPGTPVPSKRSKVEIIDYIMLCLTGSKLGNRDGGTTGS